MVSILTTKQKQFLKSTAHSLKPVVLMGANGLTPAVLKEIELALNIHELIKVKLVANDKEEKTKIIQQILKTTKAQNVQQIGNILTLYRASDKKLITLV